MNPDKLFQIIEFCIQKKIIFFENYSLKKLTTFRVGGNARIFIMPENISDTLELQKLLTDLHIEFFVLGGGSNLLISDSGFNGVVIQMKYPASIEYLTNNNESGEKLVFKISASASSSKVARQISSQSCQGLEFLTTIPGTIGGAVVQNAGCYGSEICDFIQAVFFSRHGTLEEITKDKADFSYRNSIFKKNPEMMIHYVVFEVEKGNQDEINQKIREYKNNRIKSQPANRRNAGSIFKNPETGKAWKYIADCDLAGFNIGGAEISTKHANFILNSGNATAMDIYRIIRHIQISVSEKFQIDLVPEILFLGKFDDKNN
ncbi:MAG: UDP-N-acetylmuramate dehydrogenase [Spirochaetia bacterium]|nr:UDP-N-acetylmuramate dehydrogenase [Spirochaetia bacterium]